MPHFDRLKQCPHCGVNWNVHAGLTPTCRKLQVVRKALEGMLRGGPLTAFEKREIAKKALEETK